MDYRGYGGSPGSPSEESLAADADAAVEALDRVADVDPMYMSTPDKAAALVELSKVASRLAALRLRVLAGSEDVALDDGARSADWLAHETKVDIGPSLASGRLAASLEGRWHRLRDAFAAGAVNEVVVTIDHETLLAQLGAAGLDTGERVTASEAMRLACNASVLPMVLGGAGQPLHLGRSRRLFSSAQRTAMEVRDGRCRTHGCSIPATWCEAHHRTPWARGGRTDIEDGLLLCSWHHHRARDPAYRTDTMPNGDVRFRRRT